ncbi:hypothetical protein [Lentzea aerocolonigenes]|uniref:hypothetical protein n=1 Tax=Lentzea aerocolonigenes TaxID=68170 RepID=UPI0004C41CB6|nr:hypothetical protein [Lentzea aerocolonigenes]MCP2248734.1 hypothetical protein [Lentzea aerocolonigenes]
MAKTTFTRRKIYKLVWPEGAELEGLEVRAKAIPFRAYLVIAALLDGDAPDTHEDDDGAVYDFKDNPDSQFEYVIKKFAEALVDWNLVEDDEPVPADEKGIWSQDRELVLITIRAWIDALASVSRPLAQPSPAGEPLAGVSIPMETLSESPES